MTDLDSPAHISWPYLPELASRLYVARALSNLGAPLDGYRKDSEAKPVLDALSDLQRRARASNNEYRNADANEPLDYAPVSALFASVAEGIREREGYRAHKSKKAREILLALDQALGKEPCTGCCRIHSAPHCKWTEETTERDLNTLEQHGRCLEPLKGMFDFALAVAAEAYEPFVIDGCPIKAVFLRTERITGRNTDLGMAVGGITTEGRISGLLNRYVAVRIWEQDFQPNDYFGLLYVLIHECVAHAYCGVAVDRDGYTASTAFHEGWMDEVAACVIEDAVTSDLLPIVNDTQSYGYQFLRAMHWVRSFRRACDRPGAAVDAPLWVEGIEAFTAVRLAFESVIASREGDVDDAKARAELVDLSLALNISSMTHVKRGAFVSALYETYARDTPEQMRQARLAHPELEEAIEAYLDGENAIAFLDRVVAIPVNV